MEWFVVLLIGFICVAYVIARFVLPMIGRMLAERQTAIIEAANQVETTLRETEQLRNEYRRRLERIEEETEQRMAEAVQEAEALREQILEEAREQARAIVRRGEEEVERERAKVLMNLRTQFVEDIIRAANYAAQRSLDAEHQRRLVDEFTQKVGTAS
jgi:F-type H+-transporting ATPase subunit b